MADEPEMTGVMTLPAERLSNVELAAAIDQAARLMKTADRDTRDYARVRKQFLLLLDEQLMRAGVPAEEVSG